MLVVVLVLVLVLLRLFLLFLLLLSFMVVQSIAHSNKLITKTGDIIHGIIWKRLAARTDCAHGRNCGAGVLVTGLLVAGV